MSREALLVTALAVTLWAERIETSQSIRELVVAGTLSDLRWPDFSPLRSHLRKFYEAAGYSPAWLRNGTPTLQAREMVEVLRNAALKGLDPDDYDGPRWASRIERW